MEDAYEGTLYFSIFKKTVQSTQIQQRPPANFLSQKGTNPNEETRFRNFHESAENGSRETQPQGGFMVTSDGVVPIMNNYTPANHGNFSLFMPDEIPPTGNNYSGNNNSISPPEKPRLKARGLPADFLADMSENEPNQWIFDADVEKALTTKKRPAEIANLIRDFGPYSFDTATSMSGAKVMACDMEPNVALFIDKTLLKEFLTTLKNSFISYVLVNNKNDPLPPRASVSNFMLGFMRTKCISTLIFNNLAMSSKDFEAVAKNTYEHLTTLDFESEIEGTTWTETLSLA